MTTEEFALDVLAKRCCLWLETPNGVPLNYEKLPESVKRSWRQTISHTIQFINEANEIYTE